MAQITLTQLKKYLSGKNDSDLKEELINLFKLFPQVKEYYTLKVDSNTEDETLKKYKKIIINEFFPDRGDPKLRYSVMKKAIDDFKRISPKPISIADLMVTYVESGVEFTNTYGDIDETFYTKVANMYNKALAYIFENDLEDAFWKRLSQVKENSRDIGWGFEDEMLDLYYQYFDE